MGGPEDHLPAPFSDEEILALLDSLSLGQPRSIKPLKVTAAFHIIYVLTYNTEDILSKLPVTAAKPNGASYDLILRIAGDHIPSIKTENEAAVLSWVRNNTSIPVPDLIAYDATSCNPLNREFIIFNRCAGVSISDIYDTLSPTQLDSILLQLIKILEELHSHPFTSIGGLVLSPHDGSAIIPGPVLDETMWFLPDIKSYFADTDTTLASINVAGPFPTYTSFTTASLEKYIYIAQTHPSLAFLKPYLPRLAAFLNELPKHAAVLNNTPVRLTHKDLHFANILYDPTSGLITAILDWEFAGTVPFPRWDPARAFLWNGQPGEASLKEKYRLRDRFAELCKERGVAIFKDAEFTSALQEKMHLVSNMMRCIVTTVPRGRYLDRVAEWEADLLKGLEAFGV